MPAKPIVLCDKLRCVSGGYLMSTSFYMNEMLSHTSVFRFQVCIDVRDLRMEAQRAHSLHRFPLLPHYPGITQSLPSRGNR